MTSRTPRVLLTGFGPFGKSSYNPTQAAVESLASTPGIRTAILPVDYRVATQRIRELIQEHSPDAVVSLGLAEPRSALTVERVAINLAEARIADNAGYQPQDALLANAPSPAAYFSDLPVKGMVQAIDDAGVPSALSYTAGTFVCNAVMYTALDATADLPTQAGFIHVPQATGHETEETTGKSLPQEEINRGVAAAIEYLFNPTPHEPMGVFGTLQ